MDILHRAFLLPFLGDWHLTGKDEHIPNRWLILVLVMTGVFLSTMDSGMINVALPTIMRAFDLSLEHTAFVITVYLTTITITLIFWGTLADRLGRGNIYLVGMALFSLCSLACSLAVSYQWLLFSRFMQALGASMMMSSGPALIKTVFPADQLGQSLGLVGIATACGLLTGPLVSGLLLSNYSWRAIFLITLPVGLVMVVLGKFYLLKHLDEADRQVSTPFDWSGSCCWVVIVVLGLFIIHRFDRFFSLGNGLLIVCFTLLVLLFIRLEQKNTHPFLPISLFHHTYYWTGVTTAAISFAVLFVVLALIPFYLEYIFLYEADKVGKLMMAVPATIVVLSPLSGWLYDRIGARYLTTGGLLLSGLALVGLASLRATSSPLEVAGKLALLGAGQSIFLSPNSASVLSKVSEEYLGITAGILATARNFGMVAGATLAAALFSWWYSFFSGGEKLEQYTAMHSDSFLLALRVSFVLTACLAFCGCILSVYRR